ncbi:ABC transporter substrate-binding protein [Rhodopseudomonas sp. BR0C11]|uniref:ABC transporter substrate-binding protein n=1 Tax=Rhodopseudomonas sp. BR0C11 TaxID=2269370 RepID=UPI0013E0D7DB|nr:ABC transporter substrate-binding protein [Rhodopseudomonas sp. BR0C11]NEV79508.1 ABC transporter substrate-binding protein [Rhodopseudomonas sp. BR0C11]
MMLLVASLATDASAAAAPKVVSINACTDQLLLTLADPEQIRGLSPYARDADRSFLAVQAARFPQLSGEAEDVLMLKPDFVIGGRYTKRATRELLKQMGQRIVEFDSVKTIDESKAQIRQMADLLGHPERADASIARIDAAVARAKQAASRTRLTVLPLARRGWVSGRDSLISTLLDTVGLRNAASGLGLQRGGFASLEAVVALRPDFLLISEDSDFAEDEGRAFVLHPALQRFYPPSKRITVPERLTVCGGPMLADALDRLTEELIRVER